MSGKQAIGTASLEIKLTSLMCSCIVVVLSVVIAFSVMPYAKSVFSRNFSFSAASATRDHPAPRIPDRR